MIYDIWYFTIDIRTTYKEPVFDYQALIPRKNWPTKIASKICQHILKLLLCLENDNISNFWKVQIAVVNFFRFPTK